LQRASGRHQIFPTVGWKGIRSIVYAWGNSDGGWTGHLPSEVAGKVLGAYLIVNGEN
jgi:hypothetical protein